MDAEPASGLAYHLTPARTWDALEVESGWTVGAPGDGASRGIWTRVPPLGTGGLSHESGATARPAPPPDAISTPAGQRPSRPADPAHEGELGSMYPAHVQPDSDRTPGPGTMCFVTGQGTRSDDVWENNVDGGWTTLTSPTLDLGGMTDPVIGYWQWFFSDGDANDWLAALVSNDGGSTWVAVDTTRWLHNRWEERAIRVADHLAPSARVRLRFVAADLGANTVVEAAVDDIVTYDGAAIPAGTPPEPAARTLRFRPPRPNPARGAVGLALEMPAAGAVTVEVLDLMGRRVRVLHRGPAPLGPLALRWDGADDGGRPTPAGLYFARAVAGDARASVRFARTR